MVSDAVLVIRSSAREVEEEGLIYRLGCKSMQ